MLDMLHVTSVHTKTHSKKHRRRPYSFDQKNELPSDSSITTFDDAMVYVCNSLTINVGDALLKQTALLLPEYNMIHLPANFVI